MRRWWREKDYLDNIPQKILTEDISLEEAVELIYRDVTARENGSAAAIE